MGWKSIFKINLKIILILFSLFFILYLVFLDKGYSTISGILPIVMTASAIYTLTLFPLIFLIIFIKHSSFEKYFRLNIVLIVLFFLIFFLANIPGIGILKGEKAPCIWTGPADLEITHCPDWHYYKLNRVFWVFGEKTLEDYNLIKYEMPLKEILKEISFKRTENNGFLPYLFYTIFYWYILAVLLSFGFNKFKSKFVKINKSLK